MATFKITTSWNFAHASPEDKSFEAENISTAVDLMTGSALATGKGHRLGVVGADGKVLELGTFNPAHTDWRSATSDQILLVRSLAAELVSD